jgi:hypothetical protein
VGNRPGHYRAFLSLLRNAASWETATKDYGRIGIPVMLIWGDRDWALPHEREHDHTLIPNAQMTTLERGGHFLSVDRPQELCDLIVRFASACGGLANVRFGSNADIKAAMALVRLMPISRKGSPHARDKPVTHTPGIFAVSRKASAQGSLLDENAHGESAKDQWQNKKAEP